MEEDDYESLPPTSTVITHMVAGAAAGIMEHSVMYPVDCIKTRMQCLVPDPKANYRNMADAFYRIVRYEGVGNTLRGIKVMMYGAGPAHALYFACYEKLKATLSRKGQSNHLAHVVKQRMQVFGSPYKNCMECGRRVMCGEGVRAFYRSYTTQLTLNIPFQSLHFVVYEICQDKINPERHYSPLSHTVSGGLAGAVAAAATTPLDVCKTLLNTQERCAIRRGRTSIRGLIEASQAVYRFQGIAGFFRGMVPRIIHQMPSTAISWSVYEFFKFFLTNQQQQASCDGYLSATSHVPVLTAETPD
ncbi:hypothetical protein LSH36_860g00043 [Paralvinella palmiformis]|uniref:Mitoferrin-1 n=1 Tax=Paralvinella palmiformis TaxID=53620 RepID=A0AAD9IYW0_9ANNE|nr:hypothetical protein LSH36_860g00043 [Paralvinella palmiformis]